MRFSAKNNLWGIAVVVVIGFLLFQGDGFDLGNIFGGGTTPPDDDDQISCGVLLGGNKQQLDVSAYNFKNPGTLLTAETYQLMYNGVDQGSKTGGTAVNVDPEGDYDIVVAQPGYYNASLKGTLPCETDTVLATGLGQHGSISIVTINPDGTINTNAIEGGTGSPAMPTGTRAVGTDEIVTYEIHIQVNQSDRYLSNPQLGYVYLAMNATAATNVWSGSDSKLECDSNCESTEKVSTPNSLSGAAVFQTWKVNFADTNDMADFSTIKLLATLDPAGTGTDPSGTGNVSIMLLDADYWKHTETGVFSDGVEDNTDADLGQSSAILWKPNAIAVS